MNKPIISRREILHKVSALGKDIGRDYRGKPLTVVWIYEGACFFYADVMRQARLGEQVLTACVRARSYEGTRPGELTIDGSWLEPERTIGGRNVLVIDDILETGKTLTSVVRHIEQFRPLDVKTCVLLRKPNRVEYPIEPSYLGFDIPDDFVVGYGLDHDGRYRHLRFITTIGDPAESPKAGRDRRS